MSKVSVQTRQLCDDKSWLTGSHCRSDMCIPEHITCDMCIPGWEHSYHWTSIRNNLQNGDSRWRHRVGKFRRLIFPFIYLWHRQKDSEHSSIEVCYGRLIYDANHKSVKRKLTFNRITSGKCLYPHVLFCEQFFKHVINCKLQNTPMWLPDVDACIVHYDYLKYS